MFPTRNPYVVIVMEARRHVELRSIYYSVRPTRRDSDYQLFYISKSVSEPNKRCCRKLTRYAFL